MAPPPAAIARRAEIEADAAFRFMLFCDSRHPLERLPGLDPALAEQLLRHQFAGQTMTYRALYPAARYDIVEVDGTPVGRIVVDLGDDAITLVDIALLGEWRGRGIGTRLLRDILARADRAVRLSVLRANADARRLYARLGFEVIAETEVEARMEWAPLPSPAHGSRCPDAVGSDEGTCRPLQPPSSVTASPRHLLPRAGEGEDVPIPDRLRLPLTFDPAPVAAEVAALAVHDWIAHFVPQNYAGDWSVIPLRGKAGATHPVTMIYSDPACRDYADTPVLAACPSIATILKTLACPLQAVRLMRLGPGSTIKEHVDPDLAFEQGMVRLHIPVATHPGVVFTLNGRRVAMAAGETWYLRLSDPHAVENPGPSARIHLVIDAQVNSWVTNLFAAVLAQAAGRR